jgi:hypothetical protein
MRASYVAITAVLLCTLTRAPAFAQGATDQAAKLAAARAFIKASAAVDGMVAAMRANLPAQRQAMPQVPAEFWTRFEAQMIKEAPTLGDSIAVLYARTFSLRELQDLTAFFNSPIGRRFIEVQPRLVAEGSAVGQRFGARIGEQIARELNK